MKANYNTWFHKYNQYLTSTRGDRVDFKDTKWVDIPKRMKILNDLNAELLKDQPFGVVGNDTGFAYLIDLLTKSDYSFKDIDDSLIDTYKKTLQASMSNMVVNTHTIVSHAYSNDLSKVVYDQYSGYYVIDVPFNQMHFGERDEFIRQKLQRMYSTARGNYIPIQQFISGEISNILNFSFMCTVNGYICNDCMIALDDKGFKFKVMWIMSASQMENEALEFIIYKFDVLRTHIVSINSDLISSSTHISLDDLGVKNTYGEDEEYKCLVDIYNPAYIRTGTTVPNFGMISKDGLVIDKVQSKTMEDIRYQNSKMITLIIYEIKYLHEVPNAYPATNYFDVLDDSRVYTSDASGVVDYNELRVVSSATYTSRDMPICTPPIIVDRNSSLSFETIRQCVNMRNNLLNYVSIFKKVGSALLQGDAYLEKHYETEVRFPLTRILPLINECYKNYVKGAMLTSVVPNKLIVKFNEFRKALLDMSNDKNYRNAQKHALGVDQYYDNNYSLFVDEISKPFASKNFESFANIIGVDTNFYSPEETTRFTRPISEQCFMSLKFDVVSGSWIFAYPDLEHFKGIGNSFYIKNHLKGNEVFKFFILYSDTLAMSETNVDPLKLEDVYDFDKFYDEMSRHIGYIRYWNAENKLMKLSQILYRKYDDETVVQVLGKILSGSIEADDILDKYASELKYDASGVTTLNWNNYTKTSLEAPFSINYLFYTLMMIHDNEDKMEAYFVKDLVSKKYHRRYVDINISDIIDKSITVPVSYSRYSSCPNIIDRDASSIPSNGIKAFYGVPYYVEAGTIKTTNPYLYTFNKYTNNTHYPLIMDDSINPAGYMAWSDVERFNGDEINYSNDIKVGKLISKYLYYCYTCISDIQTNLMKTYDVRYLIDNFRYNLKTVTSELSLLDRDNIHFQNDKSLNILKMVLDNNPFVEVLDDICDKLKKIDKVTFNQRTSNIRTLLDACTKMIRKVYKQTGFDNASLRRIKKLYEHLKKYNEAMNAHELLSWWRNLDMTMFRNLPKVLADNANFTESESSMESLYNYVGIYNIGDIVTIQELSEIFDSDIIQNLWETHFSKCAEYCKEIFISNIFTMYAISTCEFNTEQTYRSRPYLVIVTTGQTPHFKPNISESGKSYNLVFKAETLQNGENWKITDLTQICEYCVFSGEKLENLSATVLNAKGENIGNLTISMNFIKAGNSAGNEEIINVIPNIALTSLTFNNEHEKFDVVNNQIVNSKAADMNFELLYGNKYIQLDHDSEYLLNPDTFEEHSVEIVRIPNKTLNHILVHENGESTDPMMYFKPSQVLHIPLNDDKSLTSVFGKCFTGQTMYLGTDDGKYVVPIKITVVDHSEARGFVEAEVISEKARWFGTKDPTEIEKYMLNPVECHVLDDNMVNFVTEYHNSDYVSYNVPNPLSDKLGTAYELPGDPLFVTTNSDHVYTRLNWFFHEDIPNRFFDDETKKWNFRYMGEVFGNEYDPEYSDEVTFEPFMINLIKHNATDVTIPERYSVLREEPNDYFIWEKEKDLFSSTARRYENAVAEYSKQMANLKTYIENAKTEHQRSEYIRQYESAKRKKEFSEERAETIQGWCDQLEPPTKWYNVRSYDAAMAYIDNGRAEIAESTILDERDIPITDKVSIFLYDWQRKCWLNPSTYVFEVEYDDMEIDNKANYFTKHIAKYLKITPTEGWESSGHTLVYLAYNKSDIYDSIELNPNTCMVRFKPLITSGQSQTSEPYGKINIRKHFDGTEVYKYTGYNASEQGFDGQGIYVKRVGRNGKYLEVPVMRLCDLSVTTKTKEFDIDDIDLYIKMPFLDVTTPVQFSTPKYFVKIDTEIENFTPDEKIKLICISNNARSSYDGNISSVMFEAITSMNESGEPAIEITKSTLESFVTGTYICSVFQSKEYKSFGGVITIIIDSIKEDVVTSGGKWVRIPTKEAYYKSLPEEFVISFKEQLDFSENAKVVLKNTYKNKIDDEITIENDGMSPYEFYFNPKEFIRYPISDIRANNQKDRLIINKRKNPNVSVAKMTYIGICRYSALSIPRDGLIDVTGFIPTPLARDRYEWWINGRQVLPDDILILSPTSFQLKNLRSLKNFELIELVDDVNNSSLMKEGNVYTDNTGKAYGSYRLALLSRKSMIDQGIRYLFNTTAHDPAIDNYTRSISGDPHNMDIETDIMSTINIEKETTKYNEMHGLPTLNGMTIYNLKTSTLGIEDVPIDDIVSILDEVWKDEIIKNPLFHTTHKQTTSKEDMIVLHGVESDAIGVTGFNSNDSFAVYASGLSESFFTLYISTSIDGKIDNITDTQLIIPFVKVGVYILIDKKYKGLWLHCTEPNVKPIKL